MITNEWINAANKSSQVSAKFKKFQQLSTTINNYQQMTVEAIKKYFQRGQKSTHSKVIRFAFSISHAFGFTSTVRITKNENIKFRLG